MRIALIYPPVSLEERYGKAISKVAGNLPPLGLLYLAAVLKKQGHEVIALDGSVKTYEYIAERMEVFKPEIIGIGAMTFLWPKVPALAGKLKRRFPSARIILGGVHATIYRKQCLVESPDIDILVYGEGEYTLSELVAKIHSGGSLSDVKGIIYRDGEKLTENPPRETINNIDELPLPARELIDIHEYTPAFSQYKVKPVTNIITTRGCHYRCLFCIPDILGKKTRTRSAENIVREILHLKSEYGIRDIDIWDDNFTFDRERVISFCRLLIDEKIDIIWSAQSRVDAVDEKLLKIMSEAGCWKLHMGLESMVQKNLDTLRKRTTVEQNYAAVRMAKKHGIEVEASFIFGIPGETYEDGLETIKRVGTMRIDYARFFFLTPAGDMEKDIDRYGVVLSKEFSEYQYHKPVFVPYSLTLPELQRLVFSAYRKFYLNPAYIIKRLGKMLSPREMLINVKGLFIIMSLLVKLMDISVVKIKKRRLGHGRIS